MRNTFLAVSCLVLLSGCYVSTTNDINVGQGQSITGPQASPSPSPQCAVASAQLGTVGDAATVAPGESVGLVLSPYGQQGIELTGSCLATLTPVFSASGPCVLEGSSFNTSLRAPTGTTLNSTCTAQATVQGVRSNTVSLTVVQ